MQLSLLKYKNGRLLGIFLVLGSVMWIAYRYKKSKKNTPQQSQLKKSNLEEEEFNSRNSTNISIGKQKEEKQKNELPQIEEEPSQILSEKKINKEDQIESPQPDQQSPLPEILFPSNTIISQLYEKTIKARNVDPQFRKFVHDIESKSELFKEYSMKSAECRKVLSSLNGMRKIRGDGNCFYTAFVFQYLEYQIIEASDLEFENMIEEINTLPFEISYQDCVFQPQDFEKLQLNFITSCRMLRQLEVQHRRNQFNLVFQDDDCEFYGLAIVFIRNLAYKVCNVKDVIETFKVFGMDIKQQLLEWEHDCENNQPVIAQLSKYLKMQEYNLFSNIFMYFCDNENRKILQNKYEPPEQSTHNIYLILRPGHYCIGVPVN